MIRSAVWLSAVLLSSCVVYSQAPVSGSEPAAAPSATRPAPTIATSDTSPQIKEFQKIEDTWAEAINNRDQYSLELVLSPLFVDVSASGDITTRNQQLAQLITGEDKTMHLEQRVVTVRMLGDTSVANGTYILHHKVSGNQVDEKGVFTHVFERQHGGWVCVNSQRTVLRDDLPGKKKKGSEAEMPFHIPLFSRSDKKDQ